MWACYVSLHFIRLSEVLFDLSFVLRYYYLLRGFGLINKHFLAFVYIRCLLLQRSAMFQCHLPTGKARYRSMSTSVNYSLEINFLEFIFRFLLQHWHRLCIFNGLFLLVVSTSSEYTAPLICGPVMFHYTSFAYLKCCLISASS